ncbi:MAG: hypothetical protein QOD31_2117, partial [Pseudonocardiales bacterium]|nr:hypothetical protein [Pseudonocardiales bacterium]
MMLPCRPLRFPRLVPSRRRTVLWDVGFRCGDERGLCPAGVPFAANRGSGESRHQRHQGRPDGYQPKGD